MMGLTLHVGGLQHVSFFQKLIHTHAVCLCLSRMKNDHDQGFSQVHRGKGTWPTLITDD